MGRIAAPGAIGTVRGTGIEPPEPPQPQEVDKGSPPLTQTPPPIIQPPLGAQDLVGPQLSQEPLSKEEYAFLTLFNIKESSYRAIKGTYNIPKNASIGELIEFFKSIPAAKEKDPETSRILSVIQFVIRRYEKYLEVKEDLLRLYNLEENKEYQKLLKARNTTLQRAFGEAWKYYLEYAPAAAELKEIIAKYKITDPLNLTRADFDKMSIYEETLLSNAIEQSKVLALSNLTAFEFERIKLIDKYLLTFTTLIISQLFLRCDEKLLRGIPRKKTIEILERETRATRILKNEGEKRIALSGLTKEAQQLVKKYQKAKRELNKALETTNEEDDKSSQEHLNKIIEELAQEVKTSYEEAFEVTPSDPEKAALKALLQAISELEIIDQRIIYYARLSAPELNDDERKLIQYLYTIVISFGQENINFPSVRNMSIEEFLSKYPPEAAAALALYAQEIENEIKKFDITKPFINSGCGKSTALFFALQAAGFSESELQALQGLIILKFLKPEDKRFLSDSKEQSIDNILKELKRLHLESEVLSKLSLDQKKEQALKFQLFYGLLSSMVGECSASYFFKLKVAKLPFGSAIFAQFECAEWTPEEADDIQTRRIVTELIKYGGNYSLDAFSVIATHIRVRKILGKKVDQGFIKEVLKYTPLGQLIAIDGKYELESLEYTIIDCLVNQELEFYQEKKLHYERSKTEIKKWFTNFLKETAQKLESDSNYSLSQMFAERLAIAGAFRELVVFAEIFTEEEIDQIISENPLFVPKTNLSLQELRNGQVFRTDGYNALPEEIKKIIREIGFEEFIKANADLLQIYWLPADLQTLWAGVAVQFDKKTILLEYEHEENGKIKMLPIYFIVDTILHELTHKIYAQAVAKYQKENKENSDQRVGSLLIHERKAYLMSLKFCQEYIKSLPPGKEKKEVEDRIKRLEDIIFMANTILELKENNLDPDLTLENIRPYSPIYDIQIGYLPYTSENIEKFMEALGKFNYSEREKRWLIDELFMAVEYPKKTENFAANRRNLLIDFIQRMYSLNDPKRNGFLDLATVQAIETDKRQVNDGLDSRSISGAYLLTLAINYRP